VVVQIWGSYRFIANIFKWLTLSLLAYIGASILAHPDWRQVLAHTFMPTLTLDAKFLSIIVAILGTTISPYLFFWQASEEVEEEIALGRTSRWQRVGATKRELADAAADVGLGMFLSNLVMYFIILATAATLHRAGQTEVHTATEAAQALRPIAGDASFALMALALIGSGFLAVPILTGSGAYAVAEIFGWAYGLDEKLGHATGFYLVMTGSTMAALFINYIGIEVMKALVWVAIINGFLAPPLLIIVMLIANNREVMGEHVNGIWLNIAGWTTTAIMFAAAIALGIA
jgi:Mn2+/Fe2+ NRAMP family transporter